MAMPPRPMGSLVDSAMMSRGDDVDGLDVEVPVSTPMSFDGGAEVFEQDDGSAIIRALAEMAGDIPPEVLIPFDANLADYLDDSVLTGLSSELVSAYEDDLSSRKEWEETFTRGLDLLGVKHEERSEPFDGASAVSHPLIMESVVQFQAQAYKELLPAGGPVSSNIVGATSPETEAQASRVKNYMNYTITERMEEYDPDMDQMLFYLPLSGSTFKKIYYDNTLARPVSAFVSAQDVVVPYSAKDLGTAPRITHVLTQTDNDIRKHQLSGFYRDVELPAAGQTVSNDVTEKVDELEGVSRSYLDDGRQLLEIHTLLDIEGFENTDETGTPTGLKLPYIVTIDKSSSMVLAIRRNYDETDPLYRKLSYFSHYKFMPGLGFYGFGLTHMIGGLGKAATSILRQLIDAGTLANLPAGFKAKGIRIRDNDEPLRPGEWRDIDVPGGNIRDAIIPLPYKEPSATLAQLLGALVDAGRRFVSLADQQVSNMNQETPVGTTVALLERGLKVMSAIHKRLHYAQRNEFRILARLINKHEAAYPYAVPGGTADILTSDFDGRVDIIPVSDPNIFSMAQRVTLAQTQLQMAQTNPEMHDLRAAYRRMYQALEVQNIDELLPPPPQPQPMDAMLENGALAAGTPAMAFPQQNHQAHIEAHIRLIQTPVVAINPGALIGIYAHVQDHIKHMALQIVMGQMQQQMQQVQLAAQAGAVAPAQAQAQMVMLQRQMNDPQLLEQQASAVEVEILDTYLPRMSPPQPDPSSDPLVQIRNQELQIRALEAQNKKTLDDEKINLERNKLQQKAAGEAARLELQEEIADDRNRVNRERIEVQRQSAARKAQGGQQ